MSVIQLRAYQVKNLDHSMIDCYPQMFDLSDWSWMSQRFSECLFPLYTRQNPSIFLALEQTAWHPISSWKSSLLSSLKKLQNSKFFDTFLRKKDIQIQKSSLLFLKKLKKNYWELSKINSTAARSNSENKLDLTYDRRLV